MEAADAAFRKLLADESARIWTRMVPGTMEGLRALAAAEIPLAVVSNSDGTVEVQLAGLGNCQVGPGAGVPVRAVIDSGITGKSKPHPAMFGAGVKALNLDPSQCLYVGDSVHIDVEGARAAGLQAVHFDPCGLCGGTGHGHIRTLSGLLGGRIRP